VSTFTTWDIGGSFDWTKRRLRFQGGIGNLFDRAPPFANTVWGYDGGFHSARMRTYHTSVTYQF
jgi:outer membrane receptor protein involved in Fe transport